MSIVLITMTLAMTGITTGAAQTAATDAGCVIGKKEATCNWTAFRAALDSTRVVAVEYGATDQAVGLRLKELAARLGKKVATPEMPGGLTFVAVQPDTTGVEIGPEDQELVELRIYAGPSSRGRLLWVESYRGPADRPWPTSVQSTIQQFETHLAKPDSR